MAESLRLSRSSQLSVAIEVQCYLSDDDGMICPSDSLTASQTSSNLDTAAGAASGAYSSTITSVRSLGDCSKKIKTDLKWKRALKRIRSLRKWNISNSSAPQQVITRDSSACSDASKLSSCLHKGQETTPRALAARLRSSYAQSCSWAAGAARSLKHSSAAVSRCRLSSCLTPKTKELDDVIWPPQLLEDTQLQQQGPVQQDKPKIAADTPMDTAKDTAADLPAAAPSNTAEGSTIEAQQAADVPEPQSAAALASTAPTAVSSPSAIGPAAEAVGEEPTPVVSCAAAQPDSSTGVKRKVASDDKVEVPVDASYETARASQASNGQQQQQQQAPEEPNAVPPAQQFSFGCSAIQNGRQHMEDRVVAQDLTAHPAFHFANRAGLVAVFDGHGGHATAEYLATHLVEHITNQGAALQTDPLAVLQHAIGRAESSILAAWAPGGESAQSGSTVCLALLIDSDLHLAHVGDSRAVLSRGARSVPLTRDHKATCSAELQRIQSDDPNAHITDDGYLYGELGVSRGLGSAHVKCDPAKRAYVATPEVSTMRLEAGDDFVVLATNGLWDIVSAADAVNAARRSLAADKDPAAASQVLVERAQKLGSLDNISVVTLLLHSRGIVLPKSNSRLFSRRAVQPAAEAAAA